MKSLRVCLGLFLMASSIGFAATASAANQKGVRPCFISDLISTWEMRSINTKVKINPKDPFGWPYQRVAFDRKGDFKQVASMTPIEGNMGLIQKFNRAASTSRFSLDEKSILSITKLDSPNPERCLCSYVTRDLPAEALAKLPVAKRDQMPHQGDIVLTYMNQNGRPAVIKSFKKVPS